MTTTKLIGLRLFNITLGRIGFASRLLRHGLATALITRRKQNRYVATSRFFVWDDLK
jgi:hypothetical protein